MREAMAKIKLDLSQYDSEIYEEAMDRVELAANVIRDKARANLLVAIASAGGGKLWAKGKGRTSQAGERWREHGPYKGGAAWTARYHGEMVNTIRTVRSKDNFNKTVWIMAGNFLAWWATQLEYGRGMWKGGAKPFMRPALKGSMSEIKGILEYGGGAKEIK
jgi:hypothetical protein